MARNDVIQFTNSYGDSLSVVISDICSVQIIVDKLEIVTHMKGRETVRLANYEEGVKLLDKLRERCTDGFWITNMKGSMAYLVHAHNLRIKDGNFLYDTCVCSGTCSYTWVIASDNAEELHLALKQWLKSKYLL